MSDLTADAVLDLTTDAVTQTVEATTSTVHAGLRRIPALLRIVLGLVTVALGAILWLVTPILLERYDRPYKHARRRARA